MVGAIKNVTFRRILLVLVLKKYLLAGKYGDVEVNTVDQFQGKDKDVIIYSCTRSRPNSRSSSEDAKKKPRSDILADLRRLNVAATRARRKLVLVGDAAHLTYTYPDTFGRLLALLSAEQDVVRAPDS